MRKLAILLILAVCLTASASYAQVRVLFSHQSVGRYIVAEPGHFDDQQGLHASQDIRGELDAEVRFWDHDYYNYSNGALIDANGDLFTNSGFGSHRGSNGAAGDVSLNHILGEAFSDSPDADGQAFRDSVLSRFDIFIVKPGYRDMHEMDDLEGYKAMLNDVSDWWEINNPGKILAVCTSSPLRHYNDYVGSPGFSSAADAEAKALAYRELDIWLQNVWVCRSPYNRYFSTWWMCVNHTGTSEELYFTKDAYKTSDHHLNSTGSNAVQAALITFINELVADFEDGLPDRRRMRDLND